MTSSTSPTQPTADAMLKLAERFRACVNAAPSNGNVVLTWNTANRLLKLIAATPDLCAALEHILDGALSLPRFAEEQARAAIAKARGSSQ